MKKIKLFTNKLLIIFLLMLVALSFCACSQVSAMIITNEDDTIDEIVSITINREEIFNSEYNLNDIKYDIETNSYLKAQEMVDNLNNKIFMDLLLVSDKNSIADLNSLIDGMEVITSNWKNDTYVIGIRFKNIDVYRYYYNIKEENKVEMQTEKHFFYDKIYYYANTMYAKHNGLYNTLNNFFSTKYNGLIDSESNELLYTYVTTVRRQHSDANYITKQDGKYYHTWVVDKNNLEKPIMLYYNIANPENYIILALSITGGLSLILITISLILKGLNKNKKEDAK